MQLYYCNTNTCLTVVCVCVSFVFKDSIEANVETTEVHVQQANQQLSRAAEYQVILNGINVLHILAFLLYVYVISGWRCSDPVEDRSEICQSG